MNMTHLLKGSTSLRGLAIAAATLAPVAVSAENVTLLSQDGTIDISGEFLGFDENIFLIRTALGELRLSAERVRCEGAACPVLETVEADVVFAGSDTVGIGVMPLMLEGYAGFLDAEATIATTDQQSEIVASFVGDGGFGDDLGSYKVRSTSSSNAFANLLEGGAEIGMSSRRIRPAEARALRDLGAGDMVSPDQEHIVAIDSIVVITHPENPVKQISMDDLADIYTGKITNWSEVGGPDLAITVVDREDGAGTKSAFQERVLGENAVVTASAVIAADNNSVARFVNAEEGAISYTGYAFQRGAKALTLINECGIAMEPDAFSARTEEYALQRRLYLYNRSDDISQASKNFLDYALSPSADEVIVKAGFIDLGVDRRAQPIDSDRARMLLDPSAGALESSFMRDMLSTMVNYDRLSTTFRFRTGSSQLDERAIVDMERLTNYLSEQPEGTKVMLVGFTDEVGAFESNSVLAEGRATQVMAELAAYAGNRIGGIELDTAAYGEIAPSACNASDTGRAINRRVEVWIQAAG